MVFKVRPYAYHLLRALQPFFEIIVFTEMYHKILEFIIEHIEGVLNEPIKERIQQCKQKMEQGIKLKRKKIPKLKIFFQFIIH